MRRRSRTRQMVERAMLPPLLGLMVGCGPTGDSSGCEEAPQATDARFTSVRLESRSGPWYAGPQVPQGSDPHLVVTFACPGKSLRFLVATSVDGKIHSMKEAEGAGYGTEVHVDAGPWEAADTTWHQVQVVLDPLNLFDETDESNNRGGAEVRVFAPDAVPLASLRPARGEDRP